MAKIIDSTVICKKVKRLGVFESVDNGGQEGRCPGSFLNIFRNGYEARIKWHSHIQERGFLGRGEEGASRIISLSLVVNTDDGRKVVMNYETNKSLPYYKDLEPGCHDDADLNEFLEDVVRYFARG